LCIERQESSILRRHPHRMTLPCLRWCEGETITRWRRCSTATPKSCIPWHCACFGILPPLKMFYRKFSCRSGEIPTPLLQRVEASVLGLLSCPGTARLTLCAEDGLLSPSTTWPSRPTTIWLTKPSETT